MAVLTGMRRPQTHAGTLISGVRVWKTLSRLLLPHWQVKLVPGVWLEGPGIPELVPAGSYCSSLESGVSPLGLVWRRVQPSRREG